MCRAPHSASPTFLNNRFLFTRTKTMAHGQKVRKTISARRVVERDRKLAQFDLFDGVNRRGNVFDDETIHLQPIDNPDENDCIAVRFSRPPPPPPRLDKAAQTFRSNVWSRKRNRDREPLLFDSTTQMDVDSDARCV